MEHINLITKNDIRAIHDKLAWSKPENVHSAGKLLILGGDATGFSHVGQAYQIAQKTGAGSVRVVLPHNLQKTIPDELKLEIFFVPSVTHGGYSKRALAELLEHAAWADAVLWPSGIGKNSETTSVVERFIEKHIDLTILSGESLDPILTEPQIFFSRKNSVAVIKLEQLQKLWPKLFDPQTVPMHSWPLKKFAETLAKESTKIEATIITNIHENIIIVQQGKAAFLSYKNKIWTTEVAATVAVWSMQHPTRIFNAICAGIYELATENEDLT